MAPQYIEVSVGKLRIPLWRKRIGSQTVYTAGRIHVCVFSWGQWGRVLNYRLPVRRNTHDRRSASGLVGYTVFQPQGDGSRAGNGPPNSHKSTIFNELYFNRISIKHAGNAIKGEPSFGGNGPPKLGPRAVILIPTN